jgi:hypothetical protein
MNFPCLVLPYHSPPLWYTPVEVFTQTLPLACAAAISELEAAGVALLLVLAGAALFDAAGTIALDTGAAVLLEPAGAVAGAILELDAAGFAVEAGAAIAPPAAGFAELSFCAELVSVAAVFLLLDFFVVVAAIVSLPAALSVAAVLSPVVLSSAAVFLLLDFFVVVAAIVSLPAALSVAAVLSPVVLSAAAAAFFFFFAFFVVVSVLLVSDPVVLELACAFAKAGATTVASVRQNASAQRVTLFHERFIVSSQDEDVKPRAAGETRA